MNPIPQDLQRLLDEHEVEITGHREIPYGTQYHLSRNLEANNLNVFHTGRISVDGKPSSLRTLIEDWKLAQADRTANGIPEPARPVLDPAPRIGIDEAGKGDYFGPLVVAGVRISGERAARALHEIGVRDSKKLSAARIRRFAENIASRIGDENVRVMSLALGEYETRRKAAGNVNRLLAEINAQIISELEDEVEVVIVDEFARSARPDLELRMPEGVRLEVRTRAEDDAAVAAASILARARYLEEMERLSELVGFELPRGSTHVIETARRVVKEHGMEVLAKVAKVHFGITQQVIGSADKKEQGHD